MGSKCTIFRGISRGQKFLETLSGHCGSGEASSTYSGVLNGRHHFPYGLEYEKCCEAPFKDRPFPGTAAQFREKENRAKTKEISLEVPGKLPKLK